VIRNSIYDAATNSSRAEIVVAPATTQLMLAFRNTNNGVKDVSLRLPDVDDTQTFTSQFAQALAPFQVVRFMDFLRTNGNPVRTWAERTTPASGTQVTPKGAAYEYAIQLANELGKDIWINVPALADDAYVRSLAQLVKQGLAQGAWSMWSTATSCGTSSFAGHGQHERGDGEAIAGDTTPHRAVVHAGPVQPLR
jgi:hypothetical protein